MTETKKRAKKTAGGKPKRPVGRPRKFDSVARMQSAIDAYFDTVPQPWTVCSLGVHLNLTMEGLLEYQARAGFSEPIKKAKARIEAATAERMLRGDGWGPGHIFVLKNNYGWKDQAAVEVTGQGGGPIVMRFDKEDARL